MKNYKRKGFVGQAVNAISGLVAGVGVAIMVLILVGVLSGKTYQLNEASLNQIGILANSESWAVVSNTTTKTLAHTYVQNGTLSVLNGTNNVGLANFSINYDAGTIRTITQAWNGTTLTTSYDWDDSTIRTNIKNSITSGFQALEDTGSYMGVIVVTIVIVLVLALVMSIQGTTNSGQRGGSAL